MENRYRVLGIAPYEGMKKLMSDLVEDYPEIDLTLFVGDRPQQFPRQLRRGDLPGRDRKNAPAEPSAPGGGDSGIHVRSPVLTQAGGCFRQGGKGLHGCL